MINFRASIERYHIPGTPFHCPLLQQAIVQEHTASRVLDIVSLLAELSYSPQDGRSKQLDLGINIHQEEISDNCHGA
jgi:hypothetical protein